MVKAVLVAGVLPVLVSLMEVVSWFILLLLLLVVVAQ